MLLDEMGPCGLTQGNILLIRQNDFSLTYIQLLYYLRRKALKSNCLIYNICVFLQKETSCCRDPIFLVSSMLENVWYNRLAWSGPNPQKFLHLFLLCVHRDPKKVQNFLWVWSTSGKTMISYVFEHENRVIHWILTFWDFSNKIGLQKHTHFMYMKVNCLINFLNLRLPLCINIYFQNL